MSVPVTKVVRQVIRCQAASARRDKALMPEDPKNKSGVASGSAVSSTAGWRGHSPGVPFVFKHNIGQQVPKERLVD